MNTNGKSRQFGKSEDVPDRQPLLSVCIITYNHEEFVARTIESVLSQNTDFDFEIIVGEDDSSDNTRNIVIGYRNRYPNKIRLVLNDRRNVIFVNGRATGRWNLIRTLSSATGKYVALIEGDDYWIDPSKLQNQVSFLESHSEYSICAHWVEVVDAKGDRRTCELIGNSCPESFSIRDVLNGPPVHTGSLVFRNFNIKNDLAFPYLLVLPAADVLIIAMLLNQGKGRCIGETWGAYRIHRGGFWSSKPSCLKYFESFQIKYVFSELYPDFYSIQEWMKSSYLLALSYASAIFSSVSKASLIPVHGMLSVCVKQKVVPIGVFVLYNFLAMWLLPLCCALRLYRRIIRLISDCTDKRAV